MFIGLGILVPEMRDVFAVSHELFVGCLAHALQHLDLLLFDTAVGLEIIEICGGHGHAIYWCVYGIGAAAR